jgi:hypothetical protein
VLGAADGVSRPGQGAGDHDVAVHGVVLLQFEVRAASKGSKGSKRSRSAWMPR